MRSSNNSIIKSIKRFGKTKIVLFILLIILIVLSPFYIHNTWIKSMNDTTEQAMNIAKIAEVSLNGEMLKELRAVKEDIGSIAYNSIKKRLMELTKLDKNIRFAYFYTQREGKIFFIADSEPVDSKDYSPPGQEYTEANKEYMKPFEDGNALITQSVTDRWGTWVSILVPIKATETGKTIAVFGMDYPADTWANNAIFRTVQSTAMMFSILLMLFVLYLLSSKNARMKKSETRFRHISEIVSEIAYSCSKQEDGRFLIDWVSGAVTLITGYSVEQLLTKGCWRFLVIEEDLNIFDLNITGLSPGSKASCELRIRQKNGDIVWISSFAECVSEPRAPGVIFLYGGLTDITERKKKEEEIIYLINHDQLTGLYNRRFYEEEFKRLDIEKNLPLTLVMGDVNGLKLVNDSFGHAMGDDLLKKVAEVIKKGCRSNDVAARIGGDEFVIILPKTDAIETEKIMKHIKELLINEKVGVINVSISFGYETMNTMEKSVQDILKNIENHMYRNKLYESASVRSKTIELIMNTLYEKNNREMLHSKRVSEICEAIAASMNFDENNVNQIRIAGLMHDIGKIEIDEKILNKSEKLNKEEWEKMQRHPEIGYRILSSTNEFSVIANNVLEHHEKWDGTGYPRGLKGEEISLQARIITIADAYDAMTGDRTYVKPLSKQEAINEMWRCSGTQFDPSILKTFIEKVLGSACE